MTKPEKVLLVKQRRRRSTQNVGGKLWGYLLDWSVGYGYRPWLAAIWLISLIAIGSITFAWRPPPPVDQATSPPFNSLVYTINLLLPAGQFVQPDQWNLNGPERWFAYSLVGTGWLLASTVIAGVTRVLNRSLFLPSSPAPYGHDRPFAVGHGHSRIVETCVDSRRFGYAQTATQNGGSRAAWAPGGVRFARSRRDAGRRNRPGRRTDCEASRVREGLNCKTLCLTVQVWPTRSPFAPTTRPSTPSTC